MKKRTTIFQPDRTREGTVRFVNPDDEFDYIDVHPSYNGGITVRSVRSLVVKPEVSNVIFVNSERDL